MTNCEWFNSKIEPYFCDALNSDELQRFQGHLSSCEDCRQELESIKSVDPILRGVLQHRLAMAQTAVHANGRLRLTRLMMATGAVAAAIVLVIGLKFFQNDSAAPVVSQNPASVETAVELPRKDNTDQVADINLGKPVDGEPAKQAPQPELDQARPDGPDFSVTDAAGYTATLSTYKGRVLLVAVVSPEQEEAVQNLEQVYEAFGSNGRIGIIPVALHRDDPFRGIRFPVFFNNGSKLLGVKEGQFALLDAAGNTKLRGALADSANLTRIKNELAQVVR